MSVCVCECVCVCVYVCVCRCVCVYVSEGQTIVFMVCITCIHFLGRVNFN